MKTVADSQLGPDVAKTHQPITPSPATVSEVLTTAARNIHLIQSLAGANLLARSRENFLSALAPSHAPYWLQQLPLHFRQQATTLMAATADTVTEGLQAQQTLMAMGNSSLLASTQASLEHTSQTPSLTAEEPVASSARRLT